MGDPRKNRKRFEGPKRLWDKKRIEDEKALREEYGLKNARELWRMQTLLRRIRREARRLLSKKGADLERRTSQLLGRVKRFLVRNPDATVDDVLLLTPRDILSRRLQSVVMRKHLARTNGQARQFIVHGHIAVNGNRVTSPSYLVGFDEEDNVTWFKKPLQVAPAAPEAESAAEPTEASSADAASDESHETAERPQAAAAPEAA